MYFSNDIAEKIKKIAKKQHIAISTMLEEIGLGRNTMTNFKTSMPKADNLAKIADYLNCSVDYLLGRTDDPVLHKSADENTSRIRTVPVSVKSTKASSSQPDEEEEVQQYIAKQYFDMPASAGTGSWLGDDSSYSIINVPLTDESRKADFIIRVSGDSMEPIFYDGDKLLVVQSQVLDRGDIGVFILNNESYVKKLGSSKLISINPAYGDIKFNKYDTIFVAGKVIGKVEE